MDELKNMGFTDDQVEKLTRLSWDISFLSEANFYRSVAAIAAALRPAVENTIVAINDFARVLSKTVVPVFLKFNNRFSSVYREYKRENRKERNRQLSRGKRGLRRPKG